MKNERPFATGRSTFSDPRNAPPEGIVDVSDDLRTERLLEAYSFGIFPWPVEGYPTLWFCPAERGILEFDRLHVPRSLRKSLSRSSFTYSFNRAFDRVILACASATRAGQTGTWITPRLLAAYQKFHQAGYAHSVEVWRGERLVGGLYGVYVAGNFSGESMFHEVAGASKAALVFLIEYLRSRGLTWMDVQMVTPLLASFGASYETRDNYLNRLERAKANFKAINFI